MISVFQTFINSATQNHNLCSIKKKKNDTVPKYKNVMKILYYLPVEQDSVLSLVIIQWNLRLSN